MPALRIALFAAAILSGGFYFAREAIEDLWKEHEIGIELLMTAAIAGAAALGQWREAALVAALYSISEALEGFTIQRTPTLPTKSRRSTKLLCSRRTIAQVALNLSRGPRLYGLGMRVLGASVPIPHWAHPNGACVWPSAAVTWRSSVSPCKREDKRLLPLLAVNPRIDGNADGDAE